MPALTIPNIPEELMEKMQSHASVNGRAVEDEALLWLQSAENGKATFRKRTPEEAAKILAKADRVRASMTMIPADIAELNRCNPEGRL